MAKDSTPEVGDKISWNWGGGAPGGKVKEKKTKGAVEMTTKRGNTVKKNAEPGDAAVYIERSGHDVVKKASELNVEEKASGGGQKRKAEDDPHEENEDGKEVKSGGKEKNKAETQKKQKANNGEKRKAAPKAAPKQKKQAKPRTENTVSSRTRSQNK